MKKLVLISALSVFSFNSFAQFSLSCPEIYQKTMVAKEIKKDKAERIGSNSGKVAFVTSFGLPAVGLALFAPAIALNIYAATDSKEEKVLALIDEGSRELGRFSKKLQKRINSNISEEEILEIVKENLESGLFCQEFPHLYSPKEVKEHVEQVLRLKYASAQ